MKRLLCISVLVALLLSGCAKGKPSGLSDRAYELGIAVLETADEFIAGQIPAEDAIKKMEHTDVLLKHCDGQDDFLIASVAMRLHFSISDKANGSGTMENVEAVRDELAKHLGE